MWNKECPWKNRGRNCSTKKQLAMAGYVNFIWNPVLWRIINTSFLGVNSCSLHPTWINSELLYQVIHYLTNIVSNVTIEGWVPRNIYFLMSLLQAKLTNNRDQGDLLILGRAWLHLLLCAREPASFWRENAIAPSSFCYGFSGKSWFRSGENNLSKGRGLISV